MTSLNRFQQTSPCQLPPLVGLTTFTILLHDDTRINLQGDHGKPSRGKPRGFETLTISPNALPQRYEPNGRVAPPGPSYRFLYQTLNNLSSVTILSGYIARPNSGTFRTVANVSSVSGLELINANGSIQPVETRFVIDGTPEGYGASAFNLPVRFGREGRVTNRNLVRDETKFNETMAGRRIFGHRDCLGSSCDVELGVYPLVRRTAEPSTKSCTHMP